ncbi:uncharacterized protein LOC122254819 [Penaeus japonicus]|uniref:uncharacterized protein LOC122254819 n=1 Tax=Penaeus japonicus TaxID=27405 RepID=UPI001C7115DA|nr:uncharacterized protein LOC122254819 [Penaeus japonicus]
MLNNLCDGSIQTGRGTGCSSIIDMGSFQHLSSTMLLLEYSLDTRIISQLAVFSTGQTRGIPAATLTRLGPRPSKDHPVSSAGKAMVEFTPSLTSCVGVTLLMTLTLLMTSDVVTAGNNAYVTLEAFPAAVVSGVSRVYVTETACQCKSHCISNARCVGVSMTLEERNVTCIMTYDPAGALSLLGSQDHVTFFKDVSLGGQTPVVSGTAPANLNIVATTTDTAHGTSHAPEATTGNIVTTTASANTAATTTATQTTTALPATDQTTPTLPATDQSTPTLPATTSESTTTASPNEDYFTLTDEGTRHYCSNACLRQGRYLATIITKEDLDKFMAFWPSAGGAEIHLSLKQFSGNPNWSRYEVPFASSELGQLSLPFSINGSTALYAGFDTTTKEITHFLRWSANDPLSGIGVHCMSDGVLAAANYQHVELTYSPGFSKALQECSERGNTLALYMSLEKYRQLVTQAPPSVPYNALAVKYSAVRKRLEWIPGSVKVSSTPLNHLSPSTSGYGGCYFPEKVTTTTPHSIRFTRGFCTTRGKGVCMPIPKIAKPGMQYTYSVHSFPAGKDPWFEARRLGLQVAVLKTASQVADVFAQVDGAAWTEEYYHVALHWNPNLSLLMWEDDTPYNLTPLASDSVTQEQPSDDSDCYYIRQVNGQFRGFYGGSCDHDTLLAMRKV